MHISLSFFAAAFLLLLAPKVQAQEATVVSPDKSLKLTVSMNDGKPGYSVTYKGATMLENAPLGLTTNEGDFSSGMKYIGQSEDTVKKNYRQEKIKKSQIEYLANKLTCTFENAQQKKINIVFQVSNNDIGFRYELPAWGERMSCVVEKEATGFRFPAATTTFL